MERIKVIPVQGRLVRIPETGREITQPTMVPLTSFIRRRLKDGDLKREEPEPKKGEKNG